MSDFWIGCNYWSYNAGADMWREWDEAQIDKDFALLKQHNVTTVRVFPNWRDFQPVVPVYGYAGMVSEYLMEGEVEPANQYFLDEKMLSRFETLCDLAKKHGLQLIAGLLTGWMSGKLYIPVALYDKNLFTDALALRFEQYFVEGFVSRFQSRREIVAWDLGNECNCMSSATTAHEAFAWSSLIGSTIKATDSTRPVLSGMHGLAVENGTWTINDQARCTDMLTTHPYPSFVPHCAKDPVDSIRTLMHATCETFFYSSLGNKPCLVEEIGTLGRSVCNDTVSAEFMRLNLLSNWAHGANGLLWWCMNEQTHLDKPPYRYSMLERELGMFTAEQEPKPFLEELHRFGEWLKTVDISVTAPTATATVLLSHGQDHWGIAYMAFILAKQAGFTVNFVAPDQPLPESALYIVPVVHGDRWFYKPYYEQLKEKVHSGATVLISNSDGFYTEREDFLGTTVLESEFACDNGTFELDGALIPYSFERRQKLAATTANVLATDKNGDPLVTVNAYGNGSVYYVNFPFEETLLSKNRAFDGEAYKLYEYVARKALPTPDVTKTNPFVGITQCGDLVTLINYSNAPQKTGYVLQNGKRIDRVLRGDPAQLAPCDGSVFTIK